MPVAMFGQINAIHRRASNEKVIDNQMIVVLVCRIMKVSGGDVSESVMGRESKCQVR